MKRSNLALCGLMCVALISGAAEEKKGEPEVAGSTELKWLASIDDAKKEAAARKVPILVDFSGSDWCGWCIRLDNEVFSKPAFKEYAGKHLVLLLLDYPRSKPQTDEVKRQNRELAEQFGIEGYPTVVLLDANGKELARTGYQRGGAEAYVEHLKKLLKQ